MFKKATKKQARLRFGIEGPSGAGKTTDALMLGVALSTKKVAVIDSERGSASLYADLFDFDVADLGSFAPEKYVDTIHTAERAGYDVIVIDSLSHAWAGVGGALEMVDKAMGKSNNKWAAWREVTPEHNALVDALLMSPAHIICTMRTKTEWVLEKNDEGKNVPVKRGLAPIQRDGMEYEFTVVADVDINHVITISKTRIRMADGSSPLDGFRSKDINAMADVIKKWSETGEPVEYRKVESPKAPTENTSVEDRVARAIAAIKACNDQPALDAISQSLAKSPDFIRKAVENEFLMAQLRVSTNGAKAP